MSFWTAMVVIVAIWAFVQLKTHRRDERMGVVRDEDDNPVFAPRDDGASRREIEDSRERIKVLERFATDGNTLDASETRRISQEIEALRDRQDG